MFKTFIKRFYESWCLYGFGLVLGALFMDVLGLSHNPLCIQYVVTSSFMWLTAYYFFDIIDYLEGNYNYEQGFSN